ncbi:cellulose synthase/poly-beta-1,6-N-acetylglucosamine synthase-like glycosyltransferase [Luteibacter rhizovicinus]|uniref:Cellulose synthase/poly-beta-1,6-N-acetylglucosamine synthase-like glycosyltransferase n=1 Tax=Luteibacter rhizovicinus TaxID=242606 RepID=A0A4R3YY90_9GAMM|nr:glycosyltransferase family 2 protein [Luteibacter rhizovicinus]TCV97522.1 cellulose synthase/poly-beta-1,6-N-acetylglucosamine synthase-like glycosyltransferase [Luteibacter rhizovicinus]
MDLLSWLLIVPVWYACMVFLLLSLGLIVRRRRSAPSTTSLSWPNVTVMVPHFNESAEALFRTLASIDSQRYPGKFTVLLIDDGSTNGIQQSIAAWLEAPHPHAYRSISLPTNSGRKGRALDAGLAHVDRNADVIVVIDSDTSLGDHAVKRLVAGLWSDERYAVACGYIVPSNPRASFCTRLQYYEYTGLLSAVKVAQDVTGYVPVMAGAFVAHRVSAVRHLGGWGRWLVEDMCWTWKALAHGYKTAYVPEAMAFTECPGTLPGLYRQRRRWARGRMEAFDEISKLCTGRDAFFIPFLVNYAFCQFAFALLPVYVFGLVVQTWLTASLVLLFALFYGLAMATYLWRTGNPLGHGARHIALSIVCSRVLGVCLLWPNARGVYDQIFGNRLLWLTRH